MVKSYNWYHLSYVKCRSTMTANEAGLWLVGHLKLLCPNVSRYKNLLLSYLQMLKSFPSAETKRGRPCGTIKLLMFNNFRQPHLPQTHVGGWQSFRPKICPRAINYPSKVVRSCQIIIPEQQNQILKVVRSCKKLSTGNVYKL